MAHIQKSRTKITKKLLGFESQRQEIKEKLVGLETKDEKSFIDHASRKLSDSFVKKYLDKLDPVSKWVIIPHLVTGKALQKSDQTYNTAREAIELLGILPNEMREIDPGEIVRISSYLAPHPDNLLNP